MCLQFQVCQSNQTAQPELLVPRYAVCITVHCLFQEADPNVWLSIWQHGGGDVGTVVLVLCQPAGSTAGKPPRYTASFCAVDHHDKLHFTDHCFCFATTFIAVSFFMLVLLLVPFLLCVFGNFIPVFTSKFCFWWLVSHLTAPVMHVNKSGDSWVFE